MIGVVLGGRGWSLDPLGFRGVFGSREIVSGKFDYDEKVQYVIYGYNKGAIMIRETFGPVFSLHGGFGGSGRCQSVGFGGSFSDWLLGLGLVSSWAVLESNEFSIRHNLLFQNFYLGFWLTWGMSFLGVEGNDFLANQ